MSELTADEIVDLCLKHTLYDWQQQGSTRPIAVASARGCEFFTVDGKRYLDFNSQLMGVNIGHADPRVADAIAEQARVLPYISPFMATQVRAELGRKLAELMPGDLDKVFFTLGGAEANENAIRIAKSMTGRQKILARYRSYHGATYATITLTGDPRRWANEPGMPGVVHVLDPYHGTQRGTDDAQTALAYLEETIMLEGPETIAAFILEPVTGTNGILIPPDGYLQGVRELCDRHGILLIADEVMSGFGRTGEWFAVNHWGVVPDIITMAKGLTSSAVPLGAVGLSPKIYRYFDEHVFYGGLTYNSHPLGLRRGARDDPRVRGGRPDRAQREDGRGDGASPPGAGRQASLGRAGPQHRAVRDRRARARPRDDGADGALQRRERRDEGGRQAPGRARSVHDGPVERDHDEPAAADHRGAARGGVRDHRRGPRDRRSRRRLAA